MLNMAENNKSDSEALKVDKHQFFFETPLYAVIKTESISEKLWDGEVDAYSNTYKTPTTYTISTNKVYEYDDAYENVYRVTLKNKRKEDEKLIFFVVIVDDGVVKIGQLPSLATLQTAEVSEKYRKALDPKHYALFTKAIGLAAHGVGAGSLVYLRKIFADLIDSTYEEHKDGIGMAKAEYHKLRMDERVIKLKAHLPSQLVELKGVYSILSSGVHDLSEQECLTYFSPLKLSIELILDQHIEQKQKSDRDKAVKAEISKIQQTIKTKGETESEQKAS
jgi:hypothetical protein